MGFIQKHMKNGLSQNNLHNIIINEFLNPQRIYRKGIVMRVIAGTARRLVLKTIEGMDTRPTTDRIKETLFNILQNQLYDCVFLDLFSGSGAIGIEALSRGAREAVFVENNPKAAEVIKENLKTTKLADRAKVMCTDAATAFRRLQEQGNRFDIIFMDPPYNQEHEKRALEYLANSSMIDEDSLIITEASIQTDFSYLDDLGFELVRRKEYKTNMHAFIRKK